MKDILFPILLMIAGTIAIVVFAYESTDTYIDICVYIDIYTYAHVHTYTSTYTYTYSYKYTYTYTYNGFTRDNGKIHMGNASTERVVQSVRGEEFEQDIHEDRQRG